MEKIDNVPMILKFDGGFLRGTGELVEEGLFCDHAVIFRKDYPSESYANPDFEPWIFHAGLFEIEKGAVFYKVDFDNDAYILEAPIMIPMTYLEQITQWKK